MTSPFAHVPVYTEPHRGDRTTIIVAREDKMPGGAKMRFLPSLIPEGTREVVYGGPFCGGAAYALSVLARETGLRVSLFYAKRSRDRWHSRQVAAERNGARIVEVPHGYMTNVQAKARRYAEETGSLFLPLGFDAPAASAAFGPHLQQLRQDLGWNPDEVWCATGSGMLARHLGQAFPASRVRAVAVGLASRWAVQDMPKNVSVTQCPLEFEKAIRADCPFPSCPNYDRKAWVEAKAKASGRVLFYNVL